MMRTASRVALKGLASGTDSCRAAFEGQRVRNETFGPLLLDPLFCTALEIGGQPGKDRARDAHDGTGETDVGKAGARDHDAAHEGAGRDADVERHGLHRRGHSERARIIALGDVEEVHLAGRIHHIHADAKKQDIDEPGHETTRGEEKQEWRLSIGAQQRLDSIQGFARHHGRRHF